MTRRNLALLSSLLIALVVEPVLAVSVSASNQTPPTPANRQAPATKLSLNFKPPKKGAPLVTAGGASRSFCVTGKTPLTILTPNSNVGLTTTARPTFFLYVPKTVAKQAEFVIKDDKDNDVYRTTLELAQAPGVVSLSLPPTAPELQPNQNYRWFFSMICRPGDRLEDVFVSSWIQRVQPDKRLLGAINAAAPQGRPALYAEAGIWYDTLASLAQLRRTNDNADLSQQWANLLQSVGLNQISEAPLVAQPALRDPK